MNVGLIEISVVVGYLVLYTTVHRLQRLCELRANRYRWYAIDDLRNAEIELAKLAKRQRQALEATDPAKRRFYQRRAVELASRARSFEISAAHHEARRQRWDFWS